MTMPFLSIDWTLVVQLINTGILFLLLSKFLFKPVKAMIDSREAEVSKMYEDASAAKERLTASRRSTPPASPVPRRKPIRSSRTPRREHRCAPMRS